MDAGGSSPNIPERSSRHWQSVMDSPSAGVFAS